MFSPFRGYCLFPISGLLNLNKDCPMDEFDRILENYSVMKSAGFKQTTYLPVALYTLSMVYQGSDCSGYAEKAVDVYKEMRSNHPFLTSGDDYALAVLLANERSKLDRIEEYYHGLKSSGFSVSNGLQMMSHILAFSDESVASVVDRCVEIGKTLKANKLKVYSDYYPAIAIMALIGSDSYTQDLVEVAKYLKTQKQAKWLGKGIVVMLASAIVATVVSGKADDEKIIATLNVSVQTIIAAQQAAMIAAVSVAAASSAASS